MPSILRNLQINEGSLVDKGANPGATVVLFKRDEGGETMLEPTNEGLIDKIKSLLGMEARVTEGVTMEKTAEVIVEPAEKTDSVEISKSDLAALNERIEKAESVAQAEREARLVREYEDKAAPLAHIGNKADVAKMLRSAYDIGEEAGKALEETLKSANERIAANNGIMQEIGRGTQGGEDATAKLEKLARDKASTEGISFEKAYDTIIQSSEGRALYNEITEEV